MNSTYEALILPMHTQSGQKRPDKFGNILLTKVFYREYLKEEC